MAEKKSTPKRRSKRRPASKVSIGEHVDEQRRRLLRADAIIICVQRARDSLLGAPDEIRMADALQVASDIINDAVEALEAVARTRGGVE
jgi:hypothetical protein